MEFSDNFVLYVILPLNKCCEIHSDLLCFCYLLWTSEQYSIQY